MKRSPLKRKSKSAQRKLKEELWEICKQIVRKRDGNVCVICNKSELVGSGWHTGHFIASSVCGAFLRYDLRNLHSSCYNCNINLGSNGSVFFLSLEKKYGREFVDAIFRDKIITIKADDQFYNQKIKEYSEIQTWSKSKLLNYTRNNWKRLLQESNL